MTDDACASGQRQPAGPVDAFIALGSNLGDRHAHLAHALTRIGELPGTSAVQCSSIIETDPVGPPGQGPYLNAVVQVRTGLSPATLLANLLEIESERGRNRTQEQRFGPRTLDLDLLLFADWRVREPGLEVPHPRMAERDFVMLPLAQIAPLAAAAVRRGALH